MPAVPVPATPFPRQLLAAVQEAGPEGGLLQLGLWHGEVLTLRRVLRETDEGLVGQLEPASPGPSERGPAVAAVPWHAIARVQVVPAPARRSRPGFLPDPAADRSRTGPS